MFDYSKNRISSETPYLDALSSSPELSTEQSFTCIENTFQLVETLNDQKLFLL